MKRQKTGYLYIAPLVLIMIVLIYVPIISTLYYSVINLNLLKPGRVFFVGLKNYVDLLKDFAVLKATVNSLMIAIFVLVLTYILGLAFALLVNQKKHLKGILTATVIIPWAIPGIVSGIIWRWIFHPSFGLLNSILLKLHIIDAPMQWFSSSTIIILMVALTVAWRAIPLAVLTILSALQGIPYSLYEAATIDGCSTVKAFSHITYPMLRPSIVIVLTTTSITAINVLDEIVSLVGISSGNSTLMTAIYVRTFKYMRFSEGSALSYIVMLLCTAIGILYAKKMDIKEEER